MLFVLVWAEQAQFKVQAQLDTRPLMIVGASNSRASQRARGQTVSWKFSP